MAGVCHVASRVSTMGARRHSSITSGYSNSYTNSFEMTVISNADIQLKVGRACRLQLNDIVLPHFCRSNPTLIMELRLAEQRQTHRNTITHCALRGPAIFKFYLQVV